VGAEPAPDSRGYMTALCIAVLLRHDYEAGAARVLTPAERDAAPVLPGGRLRVLCGDAEGHRGEAGVTAGCVRPLHCGGWEAVARRPGPVQPYGAGMHLFPEPCEPRQIEGLPLPVVCRGPDPRQARLSSRAGPARPRVQCPPCRQPARQ
jgi:hypothetical protein